MTGVRELKKLRTIVRDLSIVAGGLGGLVVFGTWLASVL